MKRENWKYIILGIGLGLLLSAVLLMKFGNNQKEKLTDREIIERAKELGMIFLTESKKQDLNAESEKYNQFSDKEPKKPKEPKEQNKDTKIEKEKKLNTDNPNLGQDQNTKKQEKNSSKKEEQDDTVMEIITEPDSQAPNPLPATDPNRPKREDIFHDINF